MGKGPPTGHTPFSMLPFVKSNEEQKWRNEPHPLLGSRLLISRSVALIPALLAEIYLGFAVNLGRPV